MIKFDNFFREILDRTGITLKKFSEITEVKLNTLKSYSSGARTPDIDKIKLFADKLNIPVGYFFGEISINEALYPEMFPSTPKVMLKHVAISNEESLNPEDFIVIPFIEAIKCEGTPYFNLPKLESGIYYVMRKSRFSSDELCTFVINNDAMEPSIMRNDVVFIEGLLHDRFEDIKLENDNIYICRLDDDGAPDHKTPLIICKLQLFKKQYLVCKTDNTKYDDIIIDLTELKYNPILGRLVMIQRQM
jgi:transcriptional regulator with XRE-family HTH domain